MRGDRLFGLLWPVIIEQVLATAVTMLGSFLVSSVSEAAIAGAGLVDSFNFFVFTVLTAIATGVTVVVAQWTGSGDMERAGDTAMQSIVLSTLVAVVMAAVLTYFSRQMLSALFGDAEGEVLRQAHIFFTYSLLSLPMMALITVTSGVMRATSNVIMPMLGSMISTAAYIILSLILVLGLRMGVAGIGVSLFAARTLAAGAQCAMLWRHPGSLRLPRFRMPGMGGASHRGTARGTEAACLAEAPIARSALRLSWPVLLPVLLIALPAGFDQAIFNGSKLYVTSFVSGMGTHSLAAYAMSSSLTNLMQLPGRAFAIVVVTTVGQLYGARLYRSAQRELLRVTLLSSLALLVTSLVFIPLMPRLIAMYNPSPEGAQVARSLMNMMLWSSPILWSASFVTPCGLRTVNRVKFAMAVSSLSMLLLRLLFSYILGVRMGWGVYGIWVAMVLDWVGRGVFFMGRNLLDLRSSRDKPTEGIPRLT